MDPRHGGRSLHGPAGDVREDRRGRESDGVRASLHDRGAARDGRAVTLYFCGRAVEVSGACDDGWTWGVERGSKPCWYWATQLHSTPWRDT
jgi:hypothetical protein